VCRKLIRRYTNPQEVDIEINAMKYPEGTKNKLLTCLVFFGSCILLNYGSVDL
jgi:hypothetical protein